MHTYAHTHLRWICWHVTRGRGLTFPVARVKPLYKSNVRAKAFVLALSSRVQSMVGEPRWQELWAVVTPCPQSGTESDEHKLLYSFVYPQLRENGATQSGQGFSPQ